MNPTKWLVRGLFCLVCLNTHAQHPFNLVREEIMIPMRDNVKLGAILYRPESTVKFPAIVYRTPYGIDDYDSYAEFPLKAAKQGYMVFLVDVRGRLRSEGEFEAYRNEKNDGYDVIEWVAQHPNCNGKVGTYGGSYPGIVQWQAMAQTPPHLVAAAPEMTPIGSHHFMFYGGAFSHPWIDWFTPYILADKRKRSNDKSGPWDDEIATEEWEKSDRRQWYNYRPLAELPLLKKYAPEYYQWLTHPDSSSWWDFLNMEGDFPKFRNPVFLESGWYDAAYGPEGATRGFNKMRTLAATDVARQQSILVLGPWNHTSLDTRKTRFGDVDFGTNAGIDYDEELLRWFDRFLKNNTTERALAPVSIFVMGENKWRTENEWPLKRAIPTSYYLHADGVLSAEIPKKEKPDSYVFDPKDPFWDVTYEKSSPYDQRENEARKDVVVYTSQPLANDVEVTGEIAVELFVSSSARDTDFSFTLCDVYPDGRSINLHGLDGGYLRMRYRNSLSKQELMKPGEVYKIRIGQVYTANLFKKGHRIRVYITSSKAPHYDPNPNTGTEIATEKNLVAATNTIYHDGARASKIILPVIPQTPVQAAQTSLPKEFPAFFKEGHRGGTGLAPENTIPAMIKGIEAGANVIEVDAYTSKDGKVIITHDPHINWKISLTKEGKELTEDEANKFSVHHMNYDEIRRFDIGTKPYPAFPTQQKIKSYIPLLGELIDSVEQYTAKKKLPGVIYNIELKTSTTFDSVYNSKPEALVDAVMDVVKSKSIGNRFYIQSFDMRPLQYVQKKYPGVAIGFLLSNQNTFDENIKQLGFVPHIYSPAFKLVTPELVRRCKASKCKIVPWTVNTREDMKRLIDIGVDGIITDYPNYLSELK